MEGFNILQKVLKIQRERNAVKNALCSPELKAKMLGELDRQLDELEKQQDESKPARPKS